MKTEDFIKLLETSSKYFEQSMGATLFTDGWKLSIQGDSLDYCKYLFNNLASLFVGTKCSFKFATKRLLDSDIFEQNRKALTIYIPNDVDVKSFAELVRLNIPKYKEGIKIATPTSYEHYSGAIFYRNDRSENGRYIPAN